MHKIYIVILSVIINNASYSTSNFVVNGGLANTNFEQKYSTYKGTHTGSGTLALVTQETLSTQNLTADEFKIYPTVVTTDKAITIISNKTAIDHIDIYSVSGVLVSSLKLESRNQAVVPVGRLASGMYFLVVNGNRADTFKFLIQ